MSKYTEIIKLLDEFISYKKTSTNQMKAMESVIDELEMDSDFIDGFLHDLAFYSPIPEPHLMNYESFLPKAKRALKYFEAKASETA